MGEDYLTCVRGVFCSRKSCITHRYPSTKMVRELVQVAYDEIRRKLDLFSLKRRKLTGGSNCCIQVPKGGLENTRNKTLLKGKQ